MTDEARTAVAVAALIFAPMIIEAARARRNEQRQLARGGKEPPGDVYALMRIAYPVSFIAMIAEGWLRGFSHREWLVVGVAVFLAAKLLKSWAIASLGPSWTFRVIVVPGSGLVSSGPYRFFRHPNYIAVFGELVGAALMAGAPVAGLGAVALFAFLIARRVRVETPALAGAQAADAKSPKNHNLRT